MMVCNPITQEAEASGSRVRGQPLLYSETLLKKNNKEKVKKKLKEKFLMRSSSRCNIPKMHSCHCVVIQQDHHTSRPFDSYNPSVLSYTMFLEL